MPATPEDRFVETLGLIAHGEGMPPIAGRILGHLVLADGPCSLTEIAEALEVSKASVSTNVRLLETRGMATRVGQRGSRQDHWRVETQPHRSLLDSLALRFRRNAAQIDEIADDFAEETAGKRAKVREFSEFYRRSAEFLTHWAATLDAEDQPDRNGSR
ncbi:GbsR/MarR family transcriptional regulator [Pseudooceanicola sp.]|uniref:GbsR/MarR family transcriptional regulator n=1 Tax=Pseudooceanicola sp. TaxID=1914328 RepID=UPI0035C664E5